MPDPGDPVETAAPERDDRSFYVEDANGTVYLAEKSGHWWHSDERCNHSAHYKGGECLRASADGWTQLYHLTLHAPEGGVSSVTEAPPQAGFAAPPDVCPASTHGGCLQMYEGFGPCDEECERAPEPAVISAPAELIAQIKLQSRGDGSGVLLLSDELVDRINDPSKDADMVEVDLDLLDDVYRYEEQTDGE